MDDPPDLPGSSPDAAGESADNARSALNAFLRSSRWASKPRPRTIDDLLSATTDRRLCAGEPLCRQGEAPTHWYGIMGGLLRQDMICEDGSVTSLTAGPMGTWFGEGALILGKARSYGVSALRDSRVACIGAAAFARALEEDTGFNCAVLELVSRRLMFFMQLFADQRGLDIERRIARILLTLVGQSPAGAHPQIDITHDELAQLAGISRQRAGQALRVLQSRGLLDLSYANVTLLDMAEFAHAC